MHPRDFNSMNWMQEPLPWWAHFNTRVAFFTSSARAALAAPQTLKHDSMSYSKRIILLRKMRKREGYKEGGSEKGEEIHLGVHVKV